MINTIKCSKCHSENIKKDGKRKTENRGLIQRYKCLDCNFRFVENDGFYRMRNSSHKITLCLDLFYRGISTRGVQQHLQAFYPHNSSHKSIYKWVVKYSDLIHGYTNQLKVKTGFEVQVDEIECHRRKSHKQRLGIEENWFIDSIDTKTRYMVASNFIASRSQDNIRPIIKAIRDKSQNKISTITTDGLLQYEDPIKSVFHYSRKKRAYNIIYNRVNATKGQGFNYPIERLHNNIRARTKTFRGFHGSIDSARSIMKGYEIYYNFIRKHQALNCYPYELATDLKLTSNNKWLELIKICKK